ncbi:MAG: polysaccharide deacetylase family protein, partial [Acidimicrobiales bacterium]
AEVALRPSPARRAALAAAARRDRRLVLVYHRLGTPSSSDVVPVCPPAVFASHLQVLADVADVVPLPEIVAASRQARPPVALTFDDDEPSHVTEALPRLQAAGAPATFFLCGRALHGLGAPWWVRLERREAAAGGDPRGLARRVEGTEAAAALEVELDRADDAVLDERGLAALGRAGMGIGFHTVRHPVLTGLDDVDLDEALRDGRGDLADAAGTAVDTFAYPHGKTDLRVASRTRDAGFVLACAGGPGSIDRRTDPWRIARWEPPPVLGDRFAAMLAARLNAPVGGR